MQKMRTLCGPSQIRKQTRFKITHQKCEFADLPQSQWLAVEGAMRNANRYKKLANEMSLRYKTHTHTHNHELVWNQRIGKTIGAEDEGIVRCSKCQKWWRWKDRLTALPRAARRQQLMLNPALRMRRTLRRLQRSLPRAVVMM